MDESTCGRAARCTASPRGSLVAAIRPETVESDVRLREEAHARSEYVMNQEESLTTIGQPVPELPVADVEQAQQHYRDVLGFEIGWLYPGKEIGSVSRGNVAIFFRRRQEPFEPP